MDDLAGRQLGNYRLLRSIGSGGFADVYLGMHIYLDTPAAVKVLQARLVNDEDREAFFAEARTVAHLTHQHILRVLDFDVKENVPFLVTEYAPNGTLRERYPHQTRLTQSRIIEYVGQIAQALQYAHEHKIVHRDVKPENILLGSANEALLSDFGIAIIVQSSSAQLPEKLLGTGAYMAPEQFRGRAYPASDQYALAIMTYEWLCGERPFQGAFFDLYEQHQKMAPPPLSSRFATVPLALEAVLMKALEKQPERRFSSITEFAGELTRAARQTREFSSSLMSGGRLGGGIPSFATPHPPSSAQTPPLEPAGIETQTSEITRRKILFGPLETLPPDTLTAQVLPRLTPSTEHSRIARAPRISVSALLPTQQVQRKKRHSRRAMLSGLLAVGIASCVAGIFAEPYIHKYFNKYLDKYLNKYLRQSKKQGSSPALYIYRGHSATIWDLSWSPDSRRVASASQDSTVQIWDAITGFHSLHFRGHTAAVRAVAWSPDGKYLASGGDDNKVLIWHAGSLVHRLTYLGHSARITALAWSSDGQWIASASQDETVQIWQVSKSQEAPLLAQARITYTGHTAAVRAVAWSPDGKYLASASDDSTVQVWSARNGVPVYSYTGHTRPVQTVGWSPDGSLLASGSDDSTVQVWKPFNGTPITTYTGHSGAIHSLAWSPNGRRIASASAASGSGGESPFVHIWNAAGGTDCFLYMGHSSAVMTVGWSEDGHYLASGGNDKTVQVWRPV